MKHTLLKLIFSFLLGTITAFAAELPLQLILAASGISMLLLIFAFFRSKKRWIQDIFFGSSAIVLFFFIGILSANLQFPKNQQNHYLNHSAISEVVFLELKISEILKTDNYNRKFIAEVEKINRNKTKGKIIFYVPKDSLIDFQQKETISLIGKFEELNSPLNPHQFNYKKHLENKNVYKEINFRNIIFLKSDKPAFSIRGKAEKARQEIISKLEQNGFQGSELAIIKALLLGEKKSISKEVYASFADAGLVHILAVSGLHVGIILWLLNQVLGFLKRLPYGKFLHLTTVVILLWGFAFLAGLSPSIIRAVTMFTFVAIGLQMKRKGHIFNSIGTSILILLLVNPKYIFDVGFQLSYLAVISIVLFQPIFSNFFKPKNKVSNFFWDIFTVTCAAQLGVLPLSLFYFHQFPGLFFVSNLVILPLLGCILGFGILVIFLALLQILPNFLTQTYEFVIALLNLFVDWVAAQEAFIFKDIPFSALQCAALYLLIGLLFLLLKKFSSMKLQLFLLSCIIFQLVFIFEKGKTASSELVIFNDSRNTSIGLKINNELALLTDLDSVSEISYVKDYKTAKRIKEIRVEPVNNIFFFNSKKVLIVDSLGIYDINDKPDFILLKNSPKINLKRLITKLKPKQIIVDASNYPSFVEQWKATCQKEKVPFHDTREKGAFIVE